MADMKLKNVRLSFPVLFEPKEFQAGDGKPRYDATPLVPKGSEQDKAIWALIKQEMAAAFGKKADAQLEAWKGNANKFCYRDGDLASYDGYEGMMSLACHRRASDGAPGVFDNVRDSATGKARVIKESDGRIYAGCYVNINVSIYVISKGTFPGVFASFSGIQFAGDGDAFSGSRADDADEFDEDLADTGAEVDMV